MPNVKVLSKSNQGASMIEVLVALTVTAFGLLGLAGLQARSMSFNKDSFDRKAAAEMIEQFSERIRANFDGFATDQYHNLVMLPTDTPPLAITPCAQPQNCQPNETALRDWQMWQRDLRRYLPVSGAYVMTAGTAAQNVLVQITVAWQEGQATAGPDPICNVAPVSIADPTFRCFSWAIRP